MRLILAAGHSNNCPAAIPPDWVPHLDGKVRQTPSGTYARKSPGGNRSRF